MARSRWGKQRGPLTRKPADFRRLAAIEPIKPGAAVYRSWKWRKLSKAMRTQQPYCTKCGSANELTVDHKVGLAQLGPKPEEHPLAYDPNNLEVLCRPCHSKVENERRRTSKMDTGLVKTLRSELSWLDD